MEKVGESEEIVNNTTGALSNSTLNATGRMLLESNSRFLKYWALNLNWLHFFIYNNKKNIKLLFKLSFKIVSYIKISN